MKLYDATTIPVFDALKSASHFGLSRTRRTLYHYEAAGTKKACHPFIIGRRQDFRQPCPPNPFCVLHRLLLQTDSTLGKKEVDKRAYRFANEGIGNIRSVLWRDEDGVEHVAVLPGGAVPGFELALDSSGQWKVDPDRITLCPCEGARTTAVEPRGYGGTLASVSRPPENRFIWCQAVCADYHRDQCRLVGFVCRKENETHSSVRA